MSLTPPRARLFSRSRSTAPWDAFAMQVVEDRTLGHPCGCSDKAMTAIIVLNCALPNPQSGYIRSLTLRLMFLSTPARVNHSEAFATLGQDTTATGLYRNWRLTGHSRRIRSIRKGQVLLDTDSIPSHKTHCWAQGSCVTALPIFNPSREAIIRQLKFQNKKSFSLTSDTLPFISVFHT